MDSDLPAAGSSAPTFMVLALRDPIGANLDRIQVVIRSRHRDPNATMGFV